MSRVPSIRSKSDPEKPATLARDQGRQARRYNAPRHWCPIDISDAKGQYLASQWLQGWDEQDADIFGGGEAA